MRTSYPTIAAAVLAALVPLAGCGADAPATGDGGRLDGDRRAPIAVPAADAPAPPPPPSPPATPVAEMPTPVMPPPAGLGASSGRAAGPRVAPGEVARVAAEIEGERRWQAIVTEPTRPFLDAVGPRFDEWADVLARLSAAGQRDEADRLCAAIVGLRGHWGPALFPVDRYNAFVRDRFWVGGWRVEAAQFFEPVRFYPDDDRIVKLHRLSVYERDRVVRRYFLERSAQDGVPYHVLGRTDVATNAHQQVQPYGAAEPPYWAVMERTVADLTGAAPPAGPSSSPR